MRKLFFIFLFLLSVQTFSQQTNQQKIDSLEALLRQTDLDSFRANTYSELAKLYVGTDSVKSFDYSDKAIKISKKTSDIYNLAKAYIDRGGVYLDYVLVDSAEVNYKLSHKILKPLITKDSSEKKMKLWLRSIYSLSLVASYKTDLKSELKYKEQALELATKLNDSTILARLYNATAINYYNNEASKKAYPYFLKAGSLFKGIREYENYIYNQLIFASSLKELDSLDRMKKELDKAKYYLDNYPKSPKKPLYYLILGEYYSGIGNYKKAIENLDICNDLLLKSKTNTLKLELLVDYFQIHKKFGNKKEARKYLLKSLDGAKKSKYKAWEAEGSRQLSLYEKEAGNYSKAYQYLENYTKIIDSINYAELTQKLGNLELNYQEEKKEREILELKNENNKAQLEIEKNNSEQTILLSALGGILLLSLTGYLAFNNKKREAELKANQLQAENAKLKHEQEAKIYSALLEGQENERKRLAIDLHDGLAGRLSATSIKLANYAKQNDIENQKKYISESVKELDDSLTELRSIARNLMPETVFKYGLKAAIEDYCSSISGNKQHTKFILQFYDTDVEIPESTMLTVYRIIQELINNAVKHSNASEVLVQYMVEDGKIDITVEDNGVGFTENQIKNKHGMGLNNLRTRVAYLNGTIDFDSTLNEGTNIHIEIQV